MKTTTALFWSMIAIAAVALAGCADDGATGPAGEDATVHFSEWFSPLDWSGSPGDWYFTVSAPVLTADVVEEGVVLAYAWLGGDLYEGNAVRPLPAYAVGANWSFLVQEYGTIEFTCDAALEPATAANRFRFVAIPGTVAASLSAAGARFGDQELRGMSFAEAEDLFGR